MTELPSSLHNPEAICQAAESRLNYRSPGSWRPEAFFRKLNVNKLVCSFLIVLEYVWTLKLKVNFVCPFWKFPAICAHSPHKIVEGSHRTTKPRGLSFVEAQRFLKIKALCSRNSFHVKFRTTTQTPHGCFLWPESPSQQPFFTLQKPISSSKRLSKVFWGGEIRKHKEEDLKILKTKF